MGGPRISLPSLGVAAVPHKNRDGRQCPSRPSPQARSIVSGRKGGAAAKSDCARRILEFQFHRASMLRDDLAALAEKRFLQEKLAGGYVTFLFFILKDFFIGFFYCSKGEAHTAWGNP